MTDALYRLDEPFRASSRQADALALSRYQDPNMDDPYGFQLAFDTSNSFWEYITNDDPERGQRFGRAMRAVTLNTLQAIPTMYPFDRLALDGGVLVDIGGGLGQVGKLIISHYPNAGLKCIVQDKFADNTSAPIKAGVQLQRHDFFEVQPVRGKIITARPIHLFNYFPRCRCIFLPPHLPRLARLCLYKNPEAYRKCNGPESEPTSYLRPDRQRVKSHPTVYALRHRYDDSLWGKRAHFVGVEGIVERGKRSSVHS